MLQNSVNGLLHQIRVRATGCDRFIVAIAGPPASGKSTIADQVAAQLGPQANVLPMDGFHLDNDTLRARGLLDRKGAPETFDAAGFVTLMRRIRDTGDASFPTFDRQKDCAVPNGGRITAKTRIILVEGNYLLLSLPPWTELAAVFDLTVALVVDQDTLEKRLIARWTDHGLSAEDARLRAQKNDLQTAAFVARNAHEADIVIRNGG